MALVRLAFVCLFLSLVEAQTPTMAPTSGGCLSGWAQFGNKCYFISPGLMFKSQCDAYCPGLKTDATLLCVMSSAENSFLAAMITGAGAPYAFTGYTDVAQEGTFVWPAGCTSTYNVPWQSGEPNGGYAENYAFMQPDGQWVDTGNNQLSCMCEYNLPLPPTAAPSLSPSLSPSAAPVVTPTAVPTLAPVIIPTLAPTVPPATTCADGWMTHGEKCYKKAGSVMVHNACASYCPAQRTDATMLCFENADQNAYIASQYTNVVWLSYNDVENEGTFVWGPGCDSTYSNWTPGTPNNGNDGNYVLMSANGQFDDTSDGAAVCYCEYSLPRLPSAPPSISPSAAPTDAPSDAPTETPTAQPSVMCADGWMSHGEKCYKKADSTMLHDECVSFCPLQRADASILCLENADQNAYIVSQTNFIVWLGYNDIDSEGNFVWGPGCDSTYSNWAAGEPNNGEDASFVFMYEDGEFNDSYDGPAACFCEYSVPRVPSVRPSASPSAAPTLPTAVLAQIRSSPTYTVRNAFAFAAKAVNGDVYAWGEAPLGGNASSVVPASQLQGVTQIVPGRYSFAARKGGTVATWGIIDADLVGANLVSVVANEGAFAGIDGNGKVYAWGSKHCGGDITDPARCPDCAAHLVSGVTQVIASAAAFAAIKVDGSVLAWGSEHSGGDASAQVLASAAGAVKIVAARSAFASLLPTGRVVTWGESLTGGDSSSVQHLLVDVVHVVAAPSVFVAFKGDLSIVTWGYGKYGGDSSQVLQPLTNVVFVAHTLTAMAALKSDGTVVTWGVAGDGGDTAGVTLSGIQTIHANSKAFVAVKSAGGLVAWGRAAFGGSGLPAGLVSNTVASVHHTDRAFLAVKQNGEVVVWGQAGHGGSPDAAVRAEVSAATGLVHSVCSNEVAFSVLTSAGKVLAWGHPVSVPNPGVQFTVAALASVATCA